MIRVGTQGWGGVHSRSPRMAEIRNFTMNFGSGVTPALPALACTEMQGSFAEPAHG